MENIFRDIINSVKATEGLSDFTQRIPGCLWGIIVDSESTLGMVKVKLIGREDSEFSLRTLPTTGLSVPLAKPGDVVLVSPIEGNVHELALVGYAQNNTNPISGRTDTFNYKLGLSELQVAPESILLKVGSTTLIITETGINFTGAAGVALSITNGNVAMNCTQFTVNGKPVMVVGGKDSRNDTMVTSGQ